MSNKLHFFRQSINQCRYLNFNKTNQDHIFIDTELEYAGEFDWEFKFSITSEDATAPANYAPLFGGNVGQSRVLISVTNSNLRINIGDNNIINHAYLWQYNTIYTLRILRDSSNDVYVSINGGSLTLVGNRTGTWGGGTSVVTYVGRNAYKYFDGKIYYANLGGSDNYQFDEGSGATVTSETGGNTGTITTNQDINYINNTMWQLCP